MSGTTQYITFGIEEETFALSVEKVQVIMDLKPLSPLPHAPAYVMGLMDVRGIGILVIDLREKLGLERVPPTTSTRVIIVEAEIDGQKTSFGVVADCVFEVTDLYGAATEPVSSIGNRRQPVYIIGIGQGSH